MGRIDRRSVIGALAAAALPAQEPTFRVDVKLVRMLATVKNAQGQLVGGLTKDDFSVTDNDGGVSAPATISLTITPVNDPPVARNDAASTVAQLPVTVAVLGNDSDAENDPLNVTGASVDPSTYSTSEWITDCGWIRTSMRPDGRPKR